jgi:hypothetical protein
VVQPDNALPMNRFLCPRTCHASAPVTIRTEICPMSEILVAELRAEDRPRWNQFA